MRDGERERLGSVGDETRKAGARQVAAEVHLKHCSFLAPPRLQVVVSSPSAAPPSLHHAKVNFPLEDNYIHIGLGEHKPEWFKDLVNPAGVARLKRHTLFGPPLA